MSEDELMDRERALWSGGPETYRTSLDADCLLAFEDAVGVCDREAVAAAATDPPTSTELDMHIVARMQPAPDVMLVTYRLSVAHDGGPTYRALVSGGWVRRPGGWKLMFHHQTPLGPPRGSDRVGA